VGIKQSWIAVKDRSQAELLEALGFTEAEPVNDFVDAPYVVRQQADGWVILAGHNRRFDVDRHLPKLTEGFVFACMIDEGVMVSFARAQQDGRPLWSVTHDPDVNLDGVTVEGTPPPELDDILARLRAQAEAEGDDEVDFLFDAPQDLSASICGYRPGEQAEGGWTEVRRVDQASDKRPGLLARLFGRR